MKKESTPFNKLTVKLRKNHPALKNGGVWLNLFWSKNAGMYGHQVIAEYNIGEGFETYTTSGCGYCKSSAALEHFIIKLNKEYTSCSGDMGLFI